MKGDELVSILVAILLIGILVGGVYGGLWSLSSVVGYVPYFLWAGIIGILAWGFRKRIERSFRPDATTPYSMTRWGPPSANLDKPDWLSRFERRNSHNKKQFWEASFTSLGGGLVFLYFGFVYLRGFAPNTPVPYYDIYPIFITMEVAGAVLSVLGTLRVVAETRFQIDLRRKPRIKRGEELANWLKDFDEMFPDLENAHADLRGDILNDFNAILSRLLTKPYLWNVETRKRIAKLIDFIELNLLASNFTDKTRFISWIKWIDLKDEETTHLLQGKFTRPLKQIYDMPEFEMDPIVLTLRQELAEYHKDTMDELLNDAIYKWSDNRFGQMWGAIDLAKFKENDLDGFPKTRSYLHSLLANPDEKIHRRAYLLHKKAKDLR